MKSREGGLRDIYRDGQRKDPLILTKSLSNSLTSSSVFYCPSNPTTQRLPEVLIFLVTAISVTFAMKSHLFLDLYTVSDIYGYDCKILLSSEWMVSILWMWYH